MEQTATYRKIDPFTTSNESLDNIIRQLQAGDPVNRCDIHERNFGVARYLAIAIPDTHIGLLKRFIVELSAHNVVLIDAERTEMYRDNNRIAATEYIFDRK
jgi:hypothetical protein